MNQQVFAAICVSVISTYFGALILIYLLRTFLACAFCENFGDRELTPASSSEVEIWTNAAIRAELLVD